MKETIHEDCLRELKLISRAQMEKSALNKRSIFSFHCIRKGKRKYMDANEFVGCAAKRIIYSRNCML